MVMQGCLVKIKSAYNSLLDAERRVADYIFKNADEVINLPIREFAKRCRVSVATVARFCRAIGVLSYKTFKIQLAQDIGSSLSDICQEVSSLDSDAVIVEKIFKANIQSLYDTLKIIDMKLVQQTAQEISRAKQVVFFGTGGSGTIACDTALRLAHLGINAEYAAESYQMVIRASKLKRGDVAVGVSHSGRTKATIEALQCAKERGVRTVAITNYLGSILAKESDIVLLTAFQESEVKATALASHGAQLCIFDALYVLIARYYGKSDCIRRTNRFIEEFLRCKDKRRKRKKF